VRAADVLTTDDADGTDAPWRPLFSSVLSAVKHRPAGRAGVRASRAFLPLPWGEGRGEGAAMKHQKSSDSVPARLLRPLRVMEKARHLVNLLARGLGRNFGLSARRAAVVGW
jgi:hypothetical protein